jgi:hypothetical protein
MVLPSVPLEVVMQCRRSDLHREITLLELVNPMDDNERIFHFPQFHCTLLDDWKQKQQRIVVKKLSDE